MPKTKKAVAEEAVEKVKTVAEEAKATVKAAAETVSEKAEATVEKAKTAAKAVAAKPRRTAAKKTEAAKPKVKAEEPKAEAEVPKKTVTEDKPVNTVQAAPKQEKTYEEGIIAGLQEAIIAIMEKNGPVTDQMRRDVLNNTHHDSLIIWVKSFR